MKKWLVLGVSIAAMAAALGFMTLTGCDEDCVEDGGQCSRSSECCDGSCQAAEYAGVYRCR